METFRLRETKEFLSIDELKEKCDTMDVFMDILKVYIPNGRLAMGTHKSRNNFRRNWNNSDDTGLTFVDPTNH